MRVSVGVRAAITIVAVVSLPTTFLPAREKPTAPAALSPREVALHALNRLGFGAGPGDVDRVLGMGISRYIEEQLHPERIPEASIERRLSGLPTLQMTTAELFVTFENPVREARRLRREEPDSPRMREAMPPEMRPRRILEELAAARVLRAVYSKRQLNEVLVDFWMNHFNVYAAKGLDRVFITSFERDVVRPRIWGKFEDLLMATAKSPAMLFYLDNARSVADESNRPALPARSAGSLAIGRRLPYIGIDRRRPGPNAPTGLNENYARELMELHTLGVDGGYAQRDVTEVARALTGWSIERPEQGQGFVFRAPMHDVAPKTALGRSFPAGGGIEEGEMVIRILAHHPSTARRIASELARRLVADEPPKAVVERTAKTFLATDGDLRETVRAIVTSREFLDPSNFHAKVKSPFEFVVSAVRAAGGDTDGSALVGEIGRMGEPLYLCQPPTGYANTSAAWVNSGALVARLNFALALAAGKIPGTFADVTGLVPCADERDPKQAVSDLARALTGSDLSGDTENTISRQIECERPAAESPEAKTQVRVIAGLVLGSPEFQRE